MVQPRFLIGARIQSSERSEPEIFLCLLRFSLDMVITSMRFV